MEMGGDTHSFRSITYMDYVRGLTSSRKFSQQEDAQGSARGRGKRRGVVVVVGGDNREKEV